MKKNETINKDAVAKALGLSATSYQGLPTIDIKKVLDAIQNEELNELIPLYSIFLTKDLHVSSELNKRRSQLLTLPYLLTSDDEKIKEFLLEYLDSIKFSQLIFDISIAIPYGFSAVDLLYDNLSVNGKEIFAPSIFKIIHPRYFTYNNATRELLLNINNELYNPKDDSYKILWHDHPADSGEAVDAALMKPLLYTCLLKHTVLNYNMQYFENLGVPPIIIKYDNDKEDELISLFNQVKSLHSNSVGLFPKDSEIDLLNIGSQQDFLTTIQYFDNLISHAVNGNILSANTSGSTGSYAMSETHDGRRKDILAYDAKLIEYTINKLLKIVIELNIHPVKSSILFKFDTNNETDEVMLANTYKTLSDAGYLIPAEHISKLFNIDGITLKDSNTQLTTNIDVDEENNQRIKVEINNQNQENDLDTQIDKLTDTLNLSDEENKINVILSIVNNATTYEEAIDKVYRLYPDIQFTDIKQYLINASIISADEVKD